MGSNSKWIEGRPDESGQRIARRAIKRRLARMEHYLRRAVSAPPSETENVHQLRVFSRRAAAALEIFVEWLPERRGRWVNKQVKAVRKAAGAARDFDVLTLRWAELMQQEPSSQAALLLEQIKRHRVEAQPPIVAVHDKLVRKRFGRRVKKLLKELHVPGEGGPCDDRFDCLARVALGRLVGPYLTLARAEMSDAAALHAFRILGKQVRYAMEIFAGAFDEDFRGQLYPVVVTLQERLGAVNDHVTAQNYFVAWHADAESTAVRDALERGIDRERTAVAVSHQAFLAWWSPEQRDELAARFARYLDLSSPAASATPAPHDCPRGD
jgi:CHAD domain-containing protein